MRRGEIKKCSEELGKNFINTNPSCMPDDIENWFFSAKDSISRAETVNEVKCILEKGRDVRKKCDTPNFPITQIFVNQALTDVLNASKTRINELSGKIQKQGFSFGGAIEKTSKKNKKNLPIDSDTWWEDLIKDY